MNYKKPLCTAIWLSLSLLLVASVAPADVPAAYCASDVQRVKQLTNYCGPACLASVMDFLGKPVTQEAIGKEIYDPVSCATNGADMLLYARDKGYCAYSWNSSISDVKQKLAAGLPVIVLQQNSLADVSGHFRVLTGYDDAKGKFSVMDPYYDDIKELSYSHCERLWKSMGYWSLLVLPSGKDKFQSELDAKNPVVHMDLSYAMYKKHDWDSALREAKLALQLEPQSDFAMNMIAKIRRAAGSGAK